MPPHRLERYHAGRCMDYDSSTPADIAVAIASEIDRDVDYRPVATDGAALGRRHARRACDAAFAAARAEALRCS